MDVPDVRTEVKHSVESDAQDLRGLVEGGRGAGNRDLWVGVVLVGPGGEESDVGFGGGNFEAVAGGPLLNGGEIGGQGGLQLLDVGGGVDRGQVICVGHCERGGGAVSQEVEVQSEAYLLKRQKNL